LRGHLKHQYLIALGSNVRHHRYGAPRAVLAAALAAIAQQNIEIVAVAPVRDSRPLGPSRRCYANGAALITTKNEPEKLLRKLKGVESSFGRRPGGQRWASRVLDLDIILWNGGFHGSAALTIPHPQFRKRNFVLDPAAAIAPFWRDPLTGFTLFQLNARLTRPRALPR
jgi:2-amino-4-hydroxy-6-hydroxymethyldihydropteridine diphosphokinase